MTLTICLLMEKILPLGSHLHEFQLIDFMFLNQHSKNKQQQKSFQNVYADEYNALRKKKSIFHFLQMFFDKLLGVRAFPTEFVLQLILKCNSKEILCIKQAMCLPPMLCDTHTRGLSPIPAALSLSRSSLLL